MKKFEYKEFSRNSDLFLNSGIKDFNVFLNKLGAEGWDISKTIFIPSSGSGSSPCYFAKREITEEPAPQRSPRREMEYSRA